MRDSDNPDENPQPLACQLMAMTHTERQRYEALKARLRAAVQQTDEQPGVFALRFEADKEMILTLAEFISLESRCCPFYTFTLDVERNGGPLWLSISGPHEAMPFIKEALALKN